MKLIDRVRTQIWLAPVLGALLFVEPSAAQIAQRPAVPVFPSDTPIQFDPATDSLDYVKRDVMIPMRDGVKLPP